MAEKREIRFNLWPQLQNDDLDLMGQKKRNFFVKLFKSFEVALKFLSKRIALKEWMENLALGKYYTFFIYLARERERKLDHSHCCLRPPHVFQLKSHSHPRPADVRFGDFRANPHFLPLD